MEKLLIIVLSYLVGVAFLYSYAAFAINPSWEAKMIDRGYGVICQDGEFAFIGECDE